MAGHVTAVSARWHEEKGFLVREIEESYWEYFKQVCLQSQFYLDKEQI